MHRGVQFAGNNGRTDFGNERAALAAVLQQLAGLIGIAGRFELDDLDIDIGIGRGQPTGNFLGLGQRHRALPRADPYSSCHHSCSFNAALDSRPGSGRTIEPGAPRYRASSRIMSDAFSAIMMIAALVLPDTRSGMIEPSTTRRPSSPRTR